MMTLTLSMRFDEIDTAVAGRVEAATTSDDFEVDGVLSVHEGRDCIGGNRPARVVGVVGISVTSTELSVFAKKELAARAGFDARRAGLARELDR